MEDARTPVDRSDPSRDYRASHLAKGGDYDEAIESSPFGAYMARIERRLLVDIVPRLFPEGVSRYLDFACGTGRVTQTVAPFATVSVGVDVSPSMVARARAKCPATEFLLQDVTVQPLRTEAFDLVTAFRFLGNAQPELRAATLRAIHELLAPGGYLLVNDHRNPSSLHNLLLRVRGRDEGGDLTLRRLRALLDDTGFDVEDVHGIGLWVARHTFHRADILESRWAHRLERASRLPYLARFCPDIVVVARRR